MLRCVAVCCSVLQCGAMCCRALHCVATRTHSGESEGDVLRATLHSIIYKIQTKVNIVRAYA